MLSSSNVWVASHIRNEGSWCREVNLRILRINCSVVTLEGQTWKNTHNLHYTSGKLSVNKTEKSVYFLISNLLWAFQFTEKNKNINFVLSSWIPKPMYIYNKGIQASSFRSIILLSRGSLTCLAELLELLLWREDTQNNFCYSMKYHTYRFPERTGCFDPSFSGNKMGWRLSSLAFMIPLNNFPLLRHGVISLRAGIGKLFSTDTKLYFCEKNIHMCKCPSCITYLLPEI